MTSPADRDGTWFESFLDLLAASNVRVHLWFCPDRVVHGDEPDKPTVQWRDRVAHCLNPSCNRTSADG